MALTAGRGHLLGGIGRDDAAEQFAGRGIAGSQNRQCPVAGIEPEVRLAVAFIRAVATEAVLGEDRQNLPAELGRVGLSRETGPYRPQQAGQQHGQQQANQR